MKVLVVGGTRFFGIHLVEALLERGHDVTLATRGTHPDPFGNNVRRLKFDRTDPAGAAEALRGKSYDVVCDNIAYAPNDLKPLLDTVEAGRYVVTSSASVYSSLHPDVREEEFDPFNFPLEWCGRMEYDYAGLKRRMEAALFQAYPALPAAAVRFPVVLGSNDYTRRLFFYVEKTIKGEPFFTGDPLARQSFIHEREAGDFLAWMAEQPLTGPVNAQSAGAVSMQDVFDRVAAKTGKRPVLAAEEPAAPFHFQEGLSLSLERAQGRGFAFGQIAGWFPALVEEYIGEVLAQQS